MNRKDGHGSALDTSVITICGKAVLLGLQGVWGQCDRCDSLDRSVLAVQLPLELQGDFVSTVFVESQLC